MLEAKTVTKVKTPDFNPIPGVLREVRPIEHLPGRINSLTKPTIKPTTVRHMPEPAIHQVSIIRVLPGLVGEVLEKILRVVVKKAGVVDTVLMVAIAN